MRDSKRVGSRQRSLLLRFPAQIDTSASREYRPELKQEPNQEQLQRCNCRLSGRNLTCSLVATCGLAIPYPASKVLSYFFSALHGEARETLQNLYYILCGADNPKTWIIMRNFRFDTGFITGFDLNRKLLIKSSSGK
jgi:hypothetical protein